MAVSIGKRRHLVTLQGPSASVPDGDGGFTPTWADLEPSRAWAEIMPATARDLERVQGGTTISTNTYIVTAPFHSGLTTKSRIVYGTRTFHVTGVSNPEERGIESICICVEVVT